MMKPRLPCLLCLAIILTALLARATAQTLPETDPLESKLKQSHLFDPTRFGLPAGDLEDLFRQRLKTIHTKEISEALRKNYAQTGKQLDELFRNDPDFIKKFLENFKVKSLPAELRNKLAGKEDEFEKFFQSMDPNYFLKLARQAQGRDPVPDAGGPQPVGTATPASEPATPSGSTPLPEGESRTEESAASETSPENQPANSVLGRWLLEAANRFKDLDPSLRNSPALHRAIRELSHKVQGMDQRWKELDNSANAIAAKWARMGQVLPLDRLWPEKGFSWPHSLLPESLPNWHWPETGPRFGRPGSLTVPRTMPNMAESDSWRAFWMLASLVALGLILWKVLAHAREGKFGTGAGGWKLGPWPVDPAAVRTREELVRAFEYLSVLRLGPAARHWHHLAIASSLGGSFGAAVSFSGWRDGSAERRRAAEQLASLYERARYAPPGEPLPESALTMARRDLCLLAGVPVS